MRSRKPSAVGTARQWDFCGRPLPSEGRDVERGRRSRGAWRSRLAGRIANLADKTSNQTKQATKVGFARAAGYGRDNVLPEIERTSAKLKEHARPERLKQDYRRVSPLAA